MTSWFEQLVGEENVSDEIIDREVYSTDGSQIAGKTSKIIWVTEPKQIHQIILYAKRNKIGIVPRGSGTSLVGGTVPNNSIVIDLTKMNKIISIEKDSIEVEPGVILDDLNASLKDNFFPIIPDDSAVCTIGGMCAINSSGKYEKRFGRMKDWVLEIEMIDGNGKLRTYGNELVGTEGIFGVFTKIRLKTIKKITERSLNIFKFNTIEETMTKVSSLNYNRECISIEFIDPLAAILSSLEKKYYLITEYEGFEGEIKNENEIKRILNIRKSMFKNLASNDFIFIEDPHLPSENIAEFLYWLNKRNIPCYGPIGSGTIFPCFKTREEAHEMYNFILSLRGSAGRLSGVGLLRKNFVNETLKEEVKRLKEKFDPNYIMNPGKVI